MKYLKDRLLASILLPLAATAATVAIAGCGDDAANTPGNAVGQSAPVGTPAARAADVDRAFVRQMIPHHQMAVEMATMAKAHGEHLQIKDLAASIITSQSKEIDELTRIAGDLGVDADKPMGQSGAGASMAADARTLGLAMEEMGMSMDMRSLAGADPFDKAFIDQMTSHHEGAIAMARAQLAGGENADLGKIATAIVAAQEKEVAEMARWRADWYPSDAGTSTDEPTHHEMPGMSH